MKKQKDIFLNSEGNAWLNRNKSKKNLNEDVVLTELLNLPISSEMKVLEIGCSSGERLVVLREKHGLEVFGIDPSAEAIRVANANGVSAYQSTADCLPFDDLYFDILIFGFCLYLCDRDDLFSIAREADRVLKNPGWLIIHDFFVSTPLSRPYHHYDGVYSYKMDYRTLFTWHPCYVCMNHKILHHNTRLYTDDSQEWVGLSILRKSSFE